jgi:hypothetical protein
MKKQNKTWTVLGLAFALVIGWALAGCDSGSASGANAFAGTWTGSGCTFVFKSDMTWTYTDRDQASKNSSGTYTTSGKSAALTGKKTSGEPVNHNITINNNSFNISILTFTKTG